MADWIDPDGNPINIIETKKYEFDVFEKKLKKLEEILKTQEKRVGELEREYKEYKKVGDLIYQNMSTIDFILNEIRREHKKGPGWSAIGKKFSRKKFNGIEIDEIKNDGSIIINVNEDDWDYC
ncbi:MAG TPA: hypothetical protein EYP86_01005 [Candidatus Altiarchaeales archaeon]|nr:hypothetical protein [Candidatus Altiarchaeales archaeon]